MIILFKLLEKKITFIVILTVFVFVLSSGTIVYATIKSIVFNDFIQLSIRSAAEKNQNVSLYMKLVEETSKQLSHNPRIISVFESSGFDTSITSVLDNIISFSPNVIGISVYGDKCPGYTSSHVSHNSMTDSLKNSLLFQQFENSTNKYLWLVRNKDVADIYSTSYYDKKAIFSFISKIYDENEKITGYLLVDMHINSLYGFFQTNSLSSKLQTDTYIVTSDNDVLASPYNIAPQKFIPDNIKKAGSIQTGYLMSEDKKNIYVFNQIPDSHDEIVAAIPTNILFSQLRFFIIILLAVLVVFTILSILLGRLLAKSISQPLNHLYTEMKAPVQNIE